MVRTIEVILVGTAAWMVAVVGPIYLHAGETLRSAWEVAGAAIAVGLAVQLAMPGLKVAAALGLLARRLWGLRLAVLALALDVVTLGVSIYRFHAFDDATPPVGVGIVVVERDSALPMHVIWLLSLVALAMLGVEAIRRHTQRQHVA